MASDLKNFVFDDISKHNKTKDCWLIIDGKVYDVTPFMEDHPGGDEVLLAATGKDATDDFEDVGHSDDAREMMHNSSKKSSSMASDLKNFVFDDISKHNKTKDCWLIIDGKVYDVTPFMEDHPGGDEVLLAATGKDATDDFEDVGHSDDAREMMHKHYNPDKTQDFIVKILQFLVPLVILGLAFAVRSYTKEKSA
ncbi:cytochrome b5 [Artemisia annua]|uniref:Cytochrome b5 n=1 Tax=Artemisia annua TaxID=35608 RepID=A0A2U1QGK0_ARTAN|nr:cytochrome b5 [Artemisia annua]